jgi:hypothetical protein
MGMSTWEELLDLCRESEREFGPAPIWNYAYRALPNVNRFWVNALEQSAPSSLVWHDVCEISGTS